MVSEHCYLQHGGDVYRNPDSLDFSINLNPLGMPEMVKAALKQGVDGWERYPDPVCEELRKAIGSYYEISSDFLICGNGAAELIYLAVQVLKPKKAIVFSPSFSEYGQALKSFQCEIISFFLEKEEGFLPDMERLCRMIEEESEGHIDMVFLCNPNNPTGIFVDKKQVKILADVCKNAGTFLMIDECFCDFLEEPDKVSMMEYVREYSNIMILKAFTKTYSMAGLRLGYGVSSDKILLEKIQKMRQPWSVSIPAQEAGIAALKTDGDYLRKTRELLKSERIYLKEGLNQLGFQVFDSQANFLLFYDKRARERNLWNLCLEKGLLIRNCDNFHGLGQGYYRICLRNRKENERLLQVISEIENIEK